ncbi:hypothetical protein GGI05_005884, partial [Coemansia sp. RSA 2603]
MSSRNSTNTRPVHRGSPRNASRLREYEGFFPRHPARGHSDTSMSVIIPDMPSPLSSAPSALALKHDRRRDYFTDNSTFAAATGRAAVENVSIRYDIREHSSVEPTDTPLRSTAQTKSPTILQIDTCGSTLPKTSHSSGRGSSNGSMPLFRRTGSDQTAGAARHGNYGPNSRLPRFMIDKINSGELNGRIASGSIDGAAADASRASVSSSVSSAMCSPQSVSSSSAMQAMLELEEAKLLSAERKGQLQAVD